MNKRVNILCYIPLILLGGLLLPLLSPGYAQNTPRASESFLHFNSPISRSAFSLEQDNDGFLWISSLLEVARYDGSEFKYYNLVEGDIIQDSDGRQVDIHRDESGEIWAFCDKGKIYNYSADSDSFQLYVNIRSYDQLVFISDIYVSEQYIYVASSSGVWLVDSQGVATRLNESTYLCNTFALAEPNCLLVGTETGVVSLDMTTNTIVESTIEVGSNVITINCDSEEKIWIGTFDAGLFVYDRTTKEFVLSNPEIPKYPIRAITPLDSSTMLIGIDGCGIYSIEPEDMSVRLFASEKSVEAKIPSDKVYDIFVDNDNIWVATYTNGITLLRSNKQSCGLRMIPYDSSGAPSNQVYALLEDRDGDMWYATNMGVTLYRTQEQRWYYFLQRTNTFLTLCEDKDGFVYAGGYATGMYRIDKRRNSVEAISTGGSGSPDCIYSLLFDGEQTLFVGRLYLPMISISESGEVATYPIVNVNTIVEIDAQRLAIGTSNGFYILNKSSRESKHYFSDPESIGIKSSSQITTMLYRYGDLWFGTDGGGLCVMNLESGRIESFSTENGLPSNFIYSLVPHVDDALMWGSTMRGVFCFDAANKRHKYNILELLSESFLPASFTTLRSGSIVFGGYGGVVNLDATFDYDNHLQDNKEIVFTNLELFYKPVLKSQNPEILPRPINQVDRIKLKHNQNSLMLGFSVVDLYHQEAYYCEYFLDGFDVELSRRTTDNTINYTNIPPGSYTLKIKACSAETGQVISQRELPIVISKPLWATHVAMILYLAVFVALLYFVFLLLKERFLRNQSRDRIKILLSIVHDIRTPLSLVLTPLNSIDLHKLQDEERKNIELAQKNSSKFSSMIEELLDFNKEFVNSKSKVHKDLCDIKLLLNNKVSQYQHIAKDKGLVFNMELPIDNIYLEADIASLNRILDNLLSNAIKYSFDDSEVIIRVVLDAKRLVISVQDFGIGIPEQQQAKMFKSVSRASNAKLFSNSGKGMGSLFTRAFVKRLGADLTFESQEAVGSVFSLSFNARKFNYFSYNKTTNNEVTAHIPPKKSSSSSAHKILVVDDDQVMRDYLIDNLAGQYNVMGTSSGEEALLLLQRESVDLIITDLFMDGMRGDELCGVLKGNIASSHIYIILLTGQDDAENKIKALESGANDYITKPYSIKELQLRIKTALETQQRLKQRYIEQSNLPQLDSQVVTSFSGETQTELKATNLDEEFLVKAIKIVTDNIVNSNFSIDFMCQELAMSRTLVYEKLKALTHQSPSEFIRSIKLRRANELLQMGKYSVAEVAQMTGFNDVKYFSVLFKKYYKCSPSKVVGV